MNETDTTTRRPNRALLGIGVGVGSALGSMVSVLTGEWYWMPIVLNACIVIAVSILQTTSVRDR